MKREIASALLIGALLMTPSALAQRAQQPPAGFPDLVTALKAVPPSIRGAACSSLR